MSTIILSSNQMSTTEFKLSDFGKEPFLFGLGGKPVDHIKPYTPYCIGQPDSQNAAIIASLSNPQTAKCIADGCRIMGVDALLGLAEIYGGFDTKGTSAAAAAFNGASDSFKVFSRSLGELEQLYIAMHKAKKAGNQAQYNTFRVQAKALSDKVNKNFAAEVDKVTSMIKTKKGAPLKDFARAENIVNSSRNLTKLNFLDLTQVKNLTRTASKIQFVGNGMLLLDLGLGASKIYSEYERGGNWHKRMFVESAKLGGAAMIGGMASAGAIYLGLTLTPVGWVVIVGAAASMGYSYVTAVDKDGGAWYDAIMGIFK